MDPVIYLSVSLIKEYVRELRENLKNKIRAIGVILVVTINSQKNILILDESPLIPNIILPIFIILGIAEINNKSAPE